MKTNATKTIVLLITLCTAFFAKAQLNYQPGGFSTFASTYTDIELTGLPVVMTNNDSGNSVTPQAIGFPFTFNGHTYDSFVMYVDGFIKLGIDTVSSARNMLFTAWTQPPQGGPFNNSTSAGFNPTAGPQDTSLVVPFGGDYWGGGGGVGTPRFTVSVTGSPGSQVCTIQWKGVGEKDQTLLVQTSVITVLRQHDSIEFQVKLYETTNVIEFVYGNFYASANPSQSRFAACGLKGNNNPGVAELLTMTKASGTGWAIAAPNSQTMGVPLGNYNGTTFNALNYGNGIRPAPDPGRTYQFGPVVFNDIAVNTVYAMGKVALSSYVPDSIRANVTCPGVNGQTGVLVTLTVSGANSFTTTATIPSIASGGNAFVAFEPFMPINMGENLITVSVGIDDNNVNNSSTYGFSVSDRYMAYTDTLKSAGQGQGTSVVNFWGAKYRITGTRLITQVRAFLLGTSNAVGDTVSGVVMDTTGLILGRSPAYVVQPGDLGTFLTFNITLPPTISNSAFIAGICGGNIVNGGVPPFTYYLGAYQLEVPIRPNNDAYFSIAGWYASLAAVIPGTRFGAAPAVFSIGRLMMECSVDPLPDNDVGIIAAGPSQSVKIPINTPVTLKATVRNHGLVAQSAGVEVRYSVNGGPVIGPVTTSSSVNSFDTISVEFTGANALNFASAGTYNVKIYTSLAGDGLIGNDSFMVTYTAEPATILPYRISNNIMGTWAVENSTPALWMQGSAVQANNVFNNNVLFANNISVNNRTATIFSPTFDLTGITNPVMHFNVAHAPNTFPNTDDTLEVLLSTDGGFSYTTAYMRTSQLSSPTLGTEVATSGVYTPLGASGWRHETVNLAAAAGQPFVIIAIRDKSASGNRIYIGNISVTDATSINVLPVPGPSTYINDNIFLTFSSVGATTGELNFAKYTTPSVSTASPVFDTNTVASTSNGAIFQADQACNTQWYSITYSGIGTGNPASSAEYTISFDLTGIPGIPVPDSVYIMRRANYDAPWRPVSTTLSGSIISSGMLTGFSDFSIGSISASNPLPVNWLSFTGKGLNKFENYLQWSTASETNNDYFVVERSTDMMNFTAVQKVKSQGNSSKTQVYSIIDKLKESSSRNIYYRIKQVDADGKHTYSKVVTIKPFVQSNIDVSISNPFEGAPVIYFDNSIKASTLSIEVTDITGKVVLTQTYTLAEGRNEFTPVEFSGLRNGVYFTQIKIDDMQLNTKKLLKAK
jgi:hypothetical protein